MSVGVFKSCVRAMPECFSVLIRGDHGIGKSSVVRQLAKHFGLRVIDRRLSQMTEGDMVGLPSTDGNVTRFNPPDWFKQACDEPVALFLDELNRATPEVMQAAFQIVLDRELNGNRLHSGTRVFAAVNTAANYTVNEIDPALLDRFWVVDLCPSTSDWLDWARDTSPEGGNVDSFITDFIAAHEKWLDPPRNYEVGSKTPSRRSWHSLDRALKNAKIVDPNDALFYQLALGFLGTEASLAFVDFAKSIDNRISGEDIVERYLASKEAVRKRFAKFNSERRALTPDMVAEYLKPAKNFTDKQKKNLAAYADDIADSPEVLLALWTKLVADANDRMPFIKDVHSFLMPKVLWVFKVKPGQEGVGMTPDIPAILQPKLHVRPDPMGKACPQKVVG